MPSIDVRMSSAEAIKAARIRKRFLIREVAHKLKMSESWVRRVENGYQGVSLQHFLKLCELFEMTPNEILEAEPLTGAERESYTQWVYSRVHPRDMAYYKRKLML